MKNRKRKRGQTIVEYVLIICIVVVASVGILSLFSDVVRSKIAGIVKTFDPQAETEEAMNGTSKGQMEELGHDELPE